MPVKRNKIPSVKIFLDSGVFSIWKSGFSVELRDYIKFLHKNEQYVEHYINFDVIPGALGRKPSQDELEYSASKGWENMRVMEKEGLSPLPVFHAGERFYWLDRMLDEGYKYICISPSYIRNTKARMDWFNQVYSRICDKDGYATVDTHILGLTALAPLYTYPWTSCDSTSWMLSAAYGAAMVPRFDKGGQPDYGHDAPYTLVFSSKSPKATNGGHYLHLSKTEQAMVRRYVESNGTTVDELSKSYMHRMMLNVRIMLKAEKHIDVQRIKSNCRGFLNKNTYSKLPGKHITDRRIIFSLAPYNGFSVLLNQENANNRLWSFFLMQKEHPDFLRYYKKTGLMYGAKREVKDFTKVEEKIKKAG